MKTEYIPGDLVRYEGEIRRIAAINLRGTFALEGIKDGFIKSFLMNLY